jgi:hypothetical protein
MASNIVHYNISERIINPGEISLDNDDRISMRVKRNIYKNLRRSWEDIHTIEAVAHYLSHIKIWEDFLKNDEGEFCCVLRDRRQINDTTYLINKGNFDILLIDYENIVVDENAENNIKTFRGLHSYIISRKCIMRLMKYVYPIQVKLDSFICIYKEVFGLKIVAIKNGELTFLKEDCFLCDLPNNWNDDNVLIEKWDYYLGRIIQCGVLLAVVYQGLG